MWIVKIRCLYEVGSGKLDFGNEMKIKKNFDKEEITETQKYCKQIIKATFCCDVQG